MNIVHYKPIIDEDSEKLKSYLKERGVDMVVLNKTTKIRDDIRMYNPTVILFDYALAQEKKFHVLYTLLQEEEKIFKILFIPDFMRGEVLDKIIEKQLVSFLVSQSATEIEIYSHFKFIQENIEIQNELDAYVGKYDSIIDEYRDYKNVLEEKEKDIEALKKKIDEVIIVDPHTGLSNLKYFEIQARKGIEEGKRYKENCAILSIEIDNRFQIKEIYEEEGMDFINKKCGILLLESIRENDFAAIEDNHEAFHIFYKKIKSEVVRLVAGRLKKKIEEEVFLFNGKKIRVTLSIGLASSITHYAHNFDYEDLAEQAKIALENAIKKGRNVVVPYA